MFEFFNSTAVPTPKTLIHLSFFLPRSFPSYNCSYKFFFKKIKERLLPEALKLHYPPPVDIPQAACLC